MVTSIVMPSLTSTLANAVVGILAGGVTLLVVLDGKRVLRREKKA